MCNYTRLLPATTDVFLVIAKTCTKSIEKQIVEYDIKSTCKYSEEYSTVDKVVSENLNLVLTCNTTIFLGTFDENLFNNQGLACSHCAKIRRRN